jgi:hypothetical protein
MAFSSTVISTYGIFTSAVLWQSVTFWLGGSSPADADMTLMATTASAIDITPTNAKARRLPRRAGCWVVPRRRHAASDELEVLPVLPSGTPRVSRSRGLVLTMNSGRESLPVTPKAFQLRMLE